MRTNSQGANDLSLPLGTYVRTHAHVNFIANDETPSLSLQIND